MVSRRGVMFVAPACWASRPSGPRAKNATVGLVGVGGGYVAGVCPSGCRSAGPT